MTALSGNLHAYNTKVEVFKGIKAIWICITNRILMDINGYYYGRSRACSGEESIFSLSSAIFRVPRHQMTIARRRYKFRERFIFELRVMNVLQCILNYFWYWEHDRMKAYQEYLKEKTFRTVVIYFSIKKCFLSNMRSLYTLLCVASD
jgi:hypothetical protein